MRHFISALNAAVVQLYSGVFEVGHRCNSFFISIGTYGPWIKACVLLHLVRR